MHVGHFTVSICRASSALLWECPWRDPAMGEVAWGALQGELHLHQEQLCLWQNPTGGEVLHPLYHSSSSSSIDSTFVSLSSLQFDPHFSLFSELRYSEKSKRNWRKFAFEFSHYALRMRKDTKVCFSSIINTFMDYHICPIDWLVITGYQSNCHMECWGLNALSGRSAEKKPTVQVSYFTVANFYDSVSFTLYFHPQVWIHFHSQRGQSYWVSLSQTADDCSWGCIMIMLCSACRSYLGHSICCNNEEELYRWVAAILHAQVCSV